jgi:hypothetical protein
MSKPDMRNRLASLSFSEKIKWLEKLRDRSRAISAAGLRKQNPQPNTSSEAKRPPKTDG